MCGITGVALADVTGRPHERLLARMCAALRHRGPDDAGGMLENGIALAVRRLAVIDLPGGQQPVFNEDRTVVVVFNGEIYNFRSLRNQLIDRGHRFGSTSDTETIVHLYEEYGLDFVQHLHGMFGVAVWDFRKERLILARDRLGVKPLYYYVDDRRLCFGSELKAILQDEDVPRLLNPVAIHQLLTLGHILPPETCFDGIHELLPASLLVYQAGKVDIQSYWDLSFVQRTDYDPSQASQELFGRLRESVARRLISDVPLGAFLSGGIDSGIVVALMSQLSDEPVKTFSIGFDDASFSELPYARLIANRYHTEHHELVVQPRITDIIDELIKHHDAPFYDTSAIPTYHLSRFAREHVTVVLSGDGADEMFAGYNIYLANKVARYYQWIPSVARRMVIDPVSRLVPESSRYINRGRVLREFLRGAPLEPLERFTRWATKIKRETRQRLYRDSFLRDQLAQGDEALLAPYFERAVGANELGRLLYVGTMTELPSDMLVKVDRMSMAHSLEVRSPFLDHLLFEFAARLPDKAKLRGWTSKYLLRQVARELSLPAATLRRPKRGFSIPLDRWLREDLVEFTKQILFDRPTENRGLFDAHVVRELAQQHFEGRVSRGRELWTLLTIELWQRAYLDQFAYRVQDPEPLRLVSPCPVTKGV